MNNYNNSVIMGKLASDVKTYDNNGSLRYFFVVAINYFSKKTKKNYVDFIPTGVWSDKAIKGLDDGEKGDTVVVAGRISNRSYVKDEKTHWSMELVGHKVFVLKTKIDDESSSELMQLVKSNNSILEEILSFDNGCLSDKLLASLKGDKD